MRMERGCCEDADWGVRRLTESVQRRAQRVRWNAGLGSAARVGSCVPCGAWLRLSAEVGALRALGCPRELEPQMPEAQNRREASHDSDEGAKYSIENEIARKGDEVTDAGI